MNLPYRTPAAATRLAIALAACSLPMAVHASFLPPELMDTAAFYLAWFILVAVPIAGIALFWLVHILPEKIAHKRHHPQRDAIQTLCLLSLVFGGLLWPIAWLWAYTKPVGHQMAYGTDKHEDYFHEMDEKLNFRGRRSRRREGVMEALLLGIYSFFVWLIFIKFKWLPWTTPWKVTVVIIPVVGLTALILVLNVVAPSTNDVRVFKYTVQVIPQVRGRVIEVPVEPNRLVKKGELLFRIDPTQYQNELAVAKATLAANEAPGSCRNS